MSDLVTQTDEEAYDYFAKRYGAARSDYDLARILSGRLRNLDKRTRAANKRADALEKALRDIADERGVCSKCGKLADMPSNSVSCDNYRACTWDPQNPVEIARAALDAKGRKE